MNRKIIRIGFFRLFLAVFVVLNAFGHPMVSIARPNPANHGGVPRWQTTDPSGRLVIRFAATAGLHMGPSGLALTTSAKADGHSQRVQALVARLAPNSRLTARMPTAARTLNKSADQAVYQRLARYAQFETGIRDRLTLTRLAARLQADPAIDLAWLEPVTTPAILDFGQTSAGFPSVAADSASASFEHLQGYLGDAPAGIGALSMRGQPGALGAGITVIDVEGAWLWSHEDLPVPMAELGTPIDNSSWRWHGTAVMGVIRGQDNGLGVAGITPDCAVGGSSIGDQSTSEAILAASALLSPGDVIVIELHAAGPEATGVGQEGFVPMEFWQDNFDVIQAVTRQGILVLEAAGNGAVDLDAPIYQGLFDPSVRYSGAIMVGATDGATLDPAYFTNHGQRVDLNGWGFDVTTLAYGDLQGSPAFPEEQWYTAQFNGTSSATPVVTGAVVSLTGMVRARHGFDLDARLARDLLRLTGTPVNGPQLIGTRPDLVAAYALADTGIGEVSGVVTDQVTGLPVAEVLVVVNGSGATAVTATDGGWRLPLLVGPAAIRFSHFGYEPDSTTALITLGTPVTADMVLAPVARVDVAGVVYGNGLPLPAARIEALTLPLPAAISGLDGSFVVPQVPVGLSDQLLIYGVPGFGARVLSFSTSGATTTVSLSPVLNPVSEDFDADDGGFAASLGLWTHGTPPGTVPGAFTGNQCWGIGMNGLGYDNDQTDTLLSPLYDLSGVSAGPYFLSFHYFSDTEANFDGVNLAVSTDSTFTLLAPVEGYSDLFLGGLGQQAGWSGTSGQWTGTVFDISALTGGSFRFQLQFGSDSGVTGPGFFMDGVTLGRGLAPAPVPNSPVPAALAHLTTWPNPFNPLVNISYAVPRPGPLTVTVFDLRGRRVRQLFRAPTSDTSGRLQWDGRDDHGQAVASGVYLVRLVGSGGSQATQRVVLTK